MKSKFNIKDEALFMCLVSHAKHIIDSNDSRHDTRVLKIAKHIDIYFSKVKNTRYTTSRAYRIAKFLKEVVEPIIENNSSSVIHMLVILEYLIKNVKHMETMKMFSIHRHVVTDILYELETTEHRNITYEHFTKLDMIVDSKNY